MSDLATLLDRFSGPVLGVLSGVGSAALALKQRLGALETKVKELEPRINAVENRHVSLGTELATLKASLDALKTGLNDFEQDIHKSKTDFAKESVLADFIEGQQQQWQDIQRTLGQIEGTMKALGTTLPPASPSQRRR